MTVDHCSRSPCIMAHFIDYGKVFELQLLPKDRGARSRRCVLPERAAFPFQPVNGLPFVILRVLDSSLSCREITRV